jgi:hypothetical protein
MTIVMQAPLKVCATVRVVLFDEGVAPCSLPPQHHCSMAATVKRYGLVYLGCWHANGCALWAAAGSWGASTRHPSRCVPLHRVIALCATVQSTFV